jgi:hypothetical protein
VYEVGFFGLTEKPNRKTETELVGFLFSDEPIGCLSLENRNFQKLNLIVGLNRMPSPNKITTTIGGGV